MNPGPPVFALHTRHAVNQTLQLSQAGLMGTSLAHSQAEKSPSCSNGRCQESNPGPANASQSRHLPRPPLLEKALPVEFLPVFLLERTLLQNTRQAQIQLYACVAKHCCSHIAKAKAEPCQR